MGLDITHYKACFEKPSTKHLLAAGENFYYETGAQLKDDFNDFNVAFDHFSKYIQVIDIPREVETVVVVKNQTDLAKAKAHFQSDEQCFLLREDEAQFKQAMYKFEKQRGYQTLHKIIEEVPYTYWMLLQYYTIEKKEGFYFKHLAEQRKGMNDNFWNRFCTGPHYNFALKEDFDFALSCIVPYWPSDTPEIVQQRTAEFKRGFIDKFELGASFLSVSY